ncbi:hypothetical protein [Afipia birgiae]|uniref:hypothetical protein n=1 Tax=Afipia birgiae TaxID=151414 RepID=UPI00030A50CD|nr:hypothetical protein [Afipia birgiae]
MARFIERLETTRAVADSVGGAGAFHDPLMTFPVNYGIALRLGDRSWSRLTIRSYARQLVAGTGTQGSERRLDSIDFIGARACPGGRSGERCDEGCRENQMP